MISATAASEVSTAMVKVRGRHDGRRIESRQVRFGIGQLQLLQRLLVATAEEIQCRLRTIF